MIDALTLDAHEIAPLLWQGSKPRAGRDVADAGFQVLVLCARDYQPSSVYFPGVPTVIHAPNDDHSFVTRTDLQLAVTTASRVAEHVKRGEKVLVTCIAGINRSGLVVALALHKVFGYSGQSCIDLVRRHRKLADRDEALTNTYFVEALLKLPGETVVPPPPLVIVRDFRASRD